MKCKMIPRPERVPHNTLGACLDSLLPCETVTLISPEHVRFLGFCYRDEGFVNVERCQPEDSLRKNHADMAFSNGLVHHAQDECQ